MKIAWDLSGQRRYETGVDQGVLYPLNTANNQYDHGIAWNGLTSVNENPSGAEATNLYADNIKYLTLMSAENFGYTIESYTYPDEWEACDGSASLAAGVKIGQQPRRVFGFSYRSRLGNDVAGDQYGYKLHLIYGGQASTSSRNYQTVNESPEAITFSWEVTTTPVEVPGFKPSAYITIDSTKVDAAKLAVLEEILYGSDTAEPRLPMPAEVIALFSDGVTVAVSAESPTATLFGKQVSELQSGISVDGDAIMGTLKNVTGYTDFSSKVSEQSGHYLALKFATNPADAVTTVEVVGGTSGPVTLDADRYIVLLIKNTSQKVKVVSTKDSKSVTKTFSLTGLTLEA